MRCKYCYYPCREWAEDYHFCTACDTYYINDRIDINVELNDIYYVISMFPYKKEPTITIGTCSEPDIITIPYCNSITPQNAKQKLQTYLTFL